MAKTNLNDIASAMGVSEKPKGSISIDSDEYAGAKDFSIGDKVELVITGTVRSVTKGYDGAAVNASIDIDKVQSDDEEDADEGTEEGTAEA